MSAAEQINEREHLLDVGNGLRLSVLQLAPAEPRLCVVAGHAMMVDRRTLWRGDRECLVGTLVRRGCAVLLPDQRGHGRSGPSAKEGADWSYEDLVEDVGRYLALARELFPQLPIVLLGHSLFGHLSLAYLGLHPDAPVDAVALLAVNVWNQRWNRGAARWLKKRVLMQAAVLSTYLWGYLPVRRFRIGSVDEARTYFRELGRFVRRNAWTSPAGIDYHAAMAKLRLPVLHVVSDGDLLYAQPDDALLFTDILAAQRSVLRVGPSSARPELRALAPDHMPLVTDPRSAPVWEAVAQWMADAVKR